MIRSSTTSPDVRSFQQKCIRESSEIHKVNGEIKTGKWWENFGVLYREISRRARQALRDYIKHQGKQKQRQKRMEINRGLQSYPIIFVAIHHYFTMRLTRLIDVDQPLPLVGRNHVGSIIHRHFPGFEFH